MLKNGLEFISPIPVDRYKEVIVHLRNNFFYEEPLVKALQLIEKGEPHRELEELSTNTLNDRLSVMVYEPTTKKIAAVILNKIVVKEDVVNDVTKLKTIADDKFRKIFTLIYSTNLQYNVFEKYKVDKLFEIRMVSVDEEFRNQGIAKELAQMSEEIAIKNGFKLLKGDATSLYTQRILSRFGWEKVCEIEYEDYKTDDGEVIFNTPDPHTTFCIMAKHIGE